MTTSANTPFAFDELAVDYDAQFTHAAIGSKMRQAVWQRLDVCFPAGSRILELNCGTGEDAIYLGQRGVHVFATDLSAAMVEIARRKVAQAGLADNVRVQQLAIEHLDQLAQLDKPLFDGVLSNFGGLNCVAGLTTVGHSLAAQLRPGAPAVLCVMGPMVPWEWIWYGSHGQLAKAVRRLRPGGVRWRGLTIRYPSIGTLRRAFAPAFRQRRVSAIGSVLPPPYTEPWSGQYPRLLERLHGWERRLETVWPLPWLADHYLIELERI